jgi:hypothetical protein
MIYDLDRTGISYKHTIPDVSKNCIFDTQRLSFTPNGKFVIASTRDKHTLNELAGNQSGTLTTYVGNTTQPTKNRDFRNECPMVNYSLSCTPFQISINQSLTSHPGQIPRPRRHLRPLQRHHEPDIPHLFHRKHTPPHRMPLSSQDPHHRETEPRQAHPMRRHVPRRRRARYAELPE